MLELQVSDEYVNCPVYVFFFVHFFQRTSITVNDCDAVATIHAFDNLIHWKLTVK